MTDLKNIDVQPSPRDVQGSSIDKWMTAIGDLIRNRDIEGNGSPEGVYAAKPGTLYRRRDGGAGTCFYKKESAATLRTGWVAF